MATHEEIENTLNLIRNAWYEIPELRLGQLLINSATMANWHNPDLFYMTDSDMQTGLKEFIKTIKANKK